MGFPIINLVLHQRTALDHVRDTQTFTLVAYADCSLHLDKPSEYATPIAKIEVDRPYIYAGSNEEWCREVLYHAKRKALEMPIPDVWEGQEGGIFGTYKGI